MSLMPMITKDITLFGATGPFYPLRVTLQRGRREGRGRRKEREK